MRTYFLIWLTTLSFISFTDIFGQEAISKAFSESYIFEKNKDYKSAIKSLQNAYNADSYEINLRLGWLEYLSMNYSESQLYYRKAMTLMPYSIEAKFGYIYPTSALGNYDDVLEKYLKILEIDPQNTTANYQTGYIYYNKGDYANAHKYFGKNVNLYPFGYDSMIMFAWTNLKLGKTREAKILFNKVLLLSPENKSALEGLGLIK